MMVEPVTWAAVGMAVVANMGTWLVIIRDRRAKNKNVNPGLQPGQAEICIERGERIVKIETEHISLKEDIHEIKEAIKEIRMAVVK